MAGVSECFSIGSVVACKTCYNKIVEGEVMAFDPQTKMLILKCPASNGRSNLNDVFVVNLSLVSDVQVKKEVTTPPEPMQSLNLQRLNTRLRNSVEQKKRLISALKAGVSPEGQKLFLTITKTIDEVTWQGQNIFVLGEVTVTPPYKPENVKGDVHSKAYIHIRKVVEKHVRDSQQPNRTISPPPSCGGSSRVGGVGTEGGGGTGNKGRDSGGSSSRGGGITSASATSSSSPPMASPPPSLQTSSSTSSTSAPPPPPSASAAQ